MKIFLTGGSGLLGKELILNMENRGITYNAPTHDQFDVTNIEDTFSFSEYDVVIHCAAVAKFRDVEKDLKKTIRTNVVGTSNVVTKCMESNTRLVHISSDHVFDGFKGNYKTDDPINPLTNYAKSKASSELVVRMYNNSLVIRTSFCPREFPFDTAYIDKWSSQDYIDIIAPRIIDQSIGNCLGVIHLGHPRRSFYEQALTRKSDIKSGSVQEIIKTSTIPILIDTSLGDIL